MKNWNVTELGYSNKELHDLCMNYGKILCIVSQADTLIQTKEHDLIVSLITRTSLHGSMSIVDEINHYQEDRRIMLGKTEPTNDYIRLFELENIIFYELEKSLLSIIEYLEDKKNVSRSLDSKMDDMKKSLRIVKSLLEKKEKIMGKDFIQTVYQGLYSYCHKIALVARKNMFGKQVSHEEEGVLQLIQEELEIKNKYLSQTDIKINRHSNISFN